MPARQKNQPTAVRTAHTLEELSVPFHLPSLHDQFSQQKSSACFPVILMAQYKCGFASLSVEPSREKEVKMLYSVIRKCLHRKSRRPLQKRGFTATWAVLMWRERKRWDRYGHGRCVAGEVVPASVHGHGLEGHAIIFKPKPAGTTSTVRLQKQNSECESQTIMSSPPSTWSVVAGASVPSQLHAVASAGCTCKHLMLQKSGKPVLFRPTAAFWMAGAPGKLPPVHCGQHLVKGESTSNLLGGSSLQ